MKKFITCLIFCILLIVPSLLLAQKNITKAGKVTIEELSLQYCSIDSNARAMIISDYGKSHFSYSNEHGFRIFFDRFMRIKIFTKDGYDLGDQSISLYKTGLEREKLTNLKVITYNLEDGKIVKAKLKNSDVYTEEKNKHIDLKKFSSPQVREGSVIEIQYTVVSEFFFNLNTWYFQHDIPTLWSEYHVIIPEYFKYKRTLRGYETIAETNSSNKRASLELNSKSRTEGTVTQTNYETVKVDFAEYTEYWITRDVPAFIIEEPLTSVENYISKIEFELSSMHPPYGVVTYYTKTWEDINDLLMDDADFGGQLNGGGYLNDEVEKINLAETDDISKVVLAYDFIKEHMRWNGYKSEQAEDNLRAAFNDQSGNCAEINLMLIVLLRKLGIESEPVVLSTRNNGIVHPSQPSITTFNYVIAQARVDDKTYLMDATDPKMPFGILPVRVLNERGRLISKENSDWVSLDADKIYKSFWMYTLTLNGDLEFEGDIQASFSEYAAINQRNRLDNYADENDYIKTIVDNNQGLAINSFEIINSNDYSEPLKEKFNVTITDKTEGSEEIIYFNPIFYEAVSENPFKLEERKYPVEFPYASNESCMIVVNIPEGYTVDEMPKSTKVELPEKAGSFTYTSNLLGSKLQIVSKILITKKVFLPEEYEHLKAFYNFIIAKHAESVVLSKE